VRRDEIFVAATLVAGGLLTMAVVIPRYVAGGALGGGLSPAFMPYVAAALATLAALGMLLQALRRCDAGSAAARLTRANFRFVAASALVLGASYALMTWFGYVIGAIALVGGLLALAGVKPVPLAITAIATPVALWLLFVELLAMPLP
jgi:hypothetical protein